MYAPSQWGTMLQYNIISYWLGTSTEWPLEFELQTITDSGAAQLICMEPPLTDINLLALRWRHNGYDSVSNHQPRECLLRRLIRPTSKKTSKLRITGLCAGNSPETGEFPAQMPSNAENVSIWWRHHGKSCCTWGTSMDCSTTKPASVVSAMRYHG